MIDGHSDPNTSDDYRDAISALFTLSSTAKFALKRAGVVDYGVMPLESLWWVPGAPTLEAEDKSSLSWTAMMMQPDEVTPDVLADAVAQAAKKAPAAAVEAVRLERFAEGRAAQVMHIGPYSAEGPTIAVLHAFIADNGCEPAGKHHEIYLRDPRRAAPERLKTVVRQPVR
jgi:hypothetical protein